jgi:hypothetical protein
MANYWLPISYLKATCWLLNIASSLICNTGFFSSAIAYKCPILADLWDHIDYKKTLP